jgi:hypothetical protein
MTKGARNRNSSLQKTVPLYGRWMAVGLEQIKLI